MDPRLEEVADHLARLLELNDMPDPLLDRFASRIEECHVAEDDTEFLSRAMAKTWELINGRSSRNRLREAVGWVAENHGRDVDAVPVVITLTLIHLIGRARWLMRQTTRETIWLVIYERIERVARG
jgi:hypothetical protein